MPAEGERLETGSAACNPGWVVTVVEDLGSEGFAHVDIDHQGETTQLVVRIEGETSIERGDNVNIAFDGPVHPFGADGDRIG